VHLIDLHDAVGKRLASWIGREAMVTAGAASAPRWDRGLHDWNQPGVYPPVADTVG
jgi:hypothetical protein